LSTSEQNLTTCRLVVYTTTWCPDWIRSKRILRRLGVTFDEIDIEEIDGAEIRMKAVNGGIDRVPTIVIGSTVLVEPTESDLVAALKFRIASQQESPP
jgi:glutaredoxin